MQIRVGGLFPLALAPPGLLLGGGGGDKAFRGGEVQPLYPPVLLSF